jgi:hypothetical protein
MKCVGKLLVVLLVAATALPTSAYEIVEPFSSVMIKDDPTKPYLTYFSPEFIEDGADDQINWRMILRHDRVGDHAVGIIIIEIRSRDPSPRAMLAATLPDGGKLTIDRVNSTSKSCSAEERCWVFQKIYQKVLLEITGEEVLAANGKALRVKIGGDRPFEIEFPEKGGRSDLRTPGALMRDFRDGTAA